MNFLLDIYNGGVVSDSTSIDDKAEAIIFNLTTGQKFLMGLLISIPIIVPIILAVIYGIKNKKDEKKNNSKHEDKGEK